MMKRIFQQFERPTGVLGSIVGSIMAVENRARNEWAVTVLNIQKTDYVLEIGFGPGIAIERAAQLATAGLVAGVDHSEVMVSQASRRSTAAVRAGRVQLKQGEAEALPFPDGYFDKVFAMNSLHIWTNPRAGLAEVRRVLKSGGTVAMFEQPRSAVTEAELQSLISKIQGQLAEAGFSGFRTERKAMKPADTIGVLGIR